MDTLYLRWEQEGEDHTAREGPPSGDGRKNQMNSEKQSRKAVAAPSVDNYHEGIGPELGARALMLFSLSTHTHYYSC